MFLVIALAIIVGGISCLILYARWNYGVLEKMGIPVDKPHFILGNTADAFDKDAGTADIEKFKRLGPIYGVYEGRQPQIHIVDAELIRHVMAKDSDFFNAKRQIDFRDSFLNEMPDFLQNEKWKAVRNFLTPAFSLAKIKAMSTSMVSSSEEFATGLKKLVKESPGEKLEKYDLRDAYFVTITDLITRCCFSIQIDNPNDPNNHFANIVRKALLGEGEIASPTAEIWSYSFPILEKLLPTFISKKSAQDFRIVFKQILETRRKSGEKKKDVVDMCIEAIDKLDSEEYRRAKITKETIYFQAFVFFFAGQDQISTISATLIYKALQNPDIEKRLYEEVDTFLKKHDGKILHENLSELTYLTACLNETLRLFPFFIRAERVCTKDWKNEEFGLDIKKGMVMVIPIWAANRNPDHFPDPENFDPERFLSPNKENMHPYAFTSFGHGPRNCIGMKFSMETLIILNLTMLKYFKFHLRNDSTPVYIPGGLFFSPHMPFYFDVTVR